jgi:hypothetical protein
MKNSEITDFLKHSNLAKVSINKRCATTIKDVSTSQTSINTRKPKDYKISRLSCISL